MKKLLILLLVSTALFAQRGRNQRTVYFSASGSNTITGTATLGAYSELLSTRTADPPPLICWVQASANTSGVTINLSGLGAKSLYKLQGAINTALAANDLRTNQPACALWSAAADGFVLVSPTGNSASGGLGSDPANCSAGSLPRGVDQDGAAQGCAAVNLGTEVTSTLPVAQGGTGSATVTDLAVMVGDGSAWLRKLLPSCSNATTSKLLFNSTTREFSCGTDQTGGAATMKWYQAVMARAPVAAIGATALLPQVGSNEDGSYQGADATGAMGVLNFNEASAGQLTWTTVVPTGYTSGTLTLLWKMATTSATGNMRWEGRVLCPSGMPGAGSNFTFNTEQAATVTTPSTSLTEYSIAGLSMSGCSADSPLLINLRRLPADALDTSTADAYISHIGASL